MFGNVGNYAYLCTREEAYRADRSGMSGRVLKDLEYSGARDRQGQPEGLSFYVW